MIHGLPLSGKSTAAKRIKEYLEKYGLKADILKSVSTRYGDKRKEELTKDFIDETLEITRKEKDCAHRALCSLAEDKMKSGIIPILDATFHKLYRRRWVHDLGKRLDAEVYVISLKFDDVERIDEMLRQRQENHDFNDNILSRWEQYALMAEQADAITDDEAKDYDNIKIIKFDRKENSFRFHGCDKKDKMASMICKALMR